VYPPPPWLSQLAYFSRFEGRSFLPLFFLVNAHCVRLFLSCLSRNPSGRPDGCVLLFPASGAVPRRAEDLEFYPFCRLLIVVRSSTVSLIFFFFGRLPKPDRSLLLFAPRVCNEPISKPSSTIWYPFFFWCSLLVNFKWRFCASYLVGTLNTSRVCFFFIKRLPHFNSGVYDRS